MDMEWTSLNWTELKTCLTTSIPSFQDNLRGYWRQTTDKRLSNLPRYIQEPLLVKDNHGRLWENLQNVCIFAHVGYMWIVEVLHRWEVSLG